MPEVEDAAEALVGCIHELLWQRSRAMQLASVLHRHAETRAIAARLDLDLDAIDRASLRQQSLALAKLMED